MAVTYATPPELFGNRDKASAVATAVAPLFAALFPSNIDPSILSGLDNKSLILFAFLTLDSCICLNLILFRDIKEVSDAEKKLDNEIKKIKSIICKIISMPI